jgi:hypothetical protein
VWDDDQASRRPIALGDGDGEYVVVTKGLSSGERVLLSYPGAGLASGP